MKPVLYSFQNPIKMQEKKKELHTNIFNEHRHKNSQQNTDKPDSTTH
jgi:hypothetical protein